MYDESKTQDVDTVDNFEPIFEETIRYKIQDREITYDILGHFKPKSNFLLILGNGALRTNKYGAPTYNRGSWLKDFTYSSIVIPDPTVDMCSDLLLGWYQGTKFKPILRRTAEWIRRLIDQLNYEPSNVVFYGSSGGGFFALAMTTLIKGSSAIVLNPQTTIADYTISAVEHFVSQTGFSMDEVRNNTEFSI